MTTAEAPRWRAPLTLLLGVALISLPGATFAMLMLLHAERLALPLHAAGLFHPPYAFGLLIAALPAGSLVGCFGARRVFLASAILVVLLTLGTALPLEQLFLMALRLFQGATTGALLTACLALVRPVFAAAPPAAAAPIHSPAIPAPDRSARGFALLVATGVVATVLLSPLAGLGLAWLGTPGILLPGLALLAAVLLLARGVLPDTAAGARFDGFGTLLNLVTLVLFLSALSTAPFRPFRALVLLLLGVLSLLIWVWQARRRPVPLLPLDLLARSWGFRAAAAALLGGMALAVLNAPAPFRLMRDRSLPNDMIGLVFLVAAMGAALAALWAGWWAMRRPNRHPALVGAALMAASAVGFSLPLGGVAVATAALLLLALGRGAFETGNALALVGQAPMGREGAASGLLVAAGGAGALLAPLLTTLPFSPWLGGVSGQEGGAGALLYGAVLALLAALAASWLSARPHQHEG